LVLLLVGCGSSDDSDAGSATTTDAGTDASQPATSAGKGAATTSAAAATTAAPASGSKGTQKNPAAIGDTVTLKDTDNGDIDLTVTSFVVNANDQIAAANQFNSAPTPGTQYSLVGISATYHAGKKKSTAQFGFSVGLSVFGQSAKEITNTSCSAVVPTEIDSYADLLDGGTTAGNECFSLTSADAAGQVLLRTKESLCFSNCDEFWFKLQ